MDKHELKKIDWDARRKKYIAVCSCWHRVSIEPSALIGKSATQRDALAAESLVEHG